MKGKIAIFIPAYNEEKTIGSVVALAKKYGPVFVVDDGSADSTAKVARAAGANVIARPKNGGYGAATRTAFEAARKIDARAFVFLDGDFQHDPDEIPSVAAPVLEGKADICVGSRMMGKMENATAYRKGGVMIVNQLSALHGGSEMDYQCGFRCFSKNAAGRIKINQDGYAGASEALVSALKQKMRVAQVPVTVRYYPEREANPLAQGAGLMSFIVSEIARKRPLVFFAGGGLLLLAVSALIGIFVVRTFYSSGILPTGSALLTVFSGIAGLVLILIGINLYTLNAAMRKMGEEKK